MFRATTTALLVTSACSVTPNADPVAGAPTTIGTADTGTTPDGEGTDDDLDDDPDDDLGDDLGDADTTLGGDAGVDDAVFDLGGMPDVPVDVGPCACAPQTDLVQVLSSSGELWSFDPATLSFASIGAVDCPVFSTQSFSLAVSRTGDVLVEFLSTGDVFALSLDDVTCSDPGYEPPPAEPRRFGLAFVADDLRTAAPCESLLGVGYSGGGWDEGPGIGTLVELDPDTLQRTELGALDYDGGELAGTADGRLFVFAGVPEAELSELDPQTGAVLSTLPLPGVTLTDAFAMAFWGGDFWFFVEAPGSDVSRVLRLDYDDSEGRGAAALTTAVEQAPIRIVGAASSTCVPTQPAG